MAVSATASAKERPVFSVKVLESIARSVQGLAGEKGERRKELLDETQRRIHKAYPELVSATPGKWIFNAVGGSLAEIQVLFCSPREYLSIWGAPLETDGFSGRYNKMDVWDIMLDGLMHSYAPGGNHQADLYMNGANAEGKSGKLTSLLKRGDGKHFRLQQGAYMIDYGRGNLLLSLKAGAILGHKYVTGDRKSMHAMLGGCAAQTFHNWLSPERREAMERYRATNPDFH
jgi:sigma non-opioid intracellular receptor